VTSTREIKAQASYDLDDEIMASLTVTSPAGEQFTAEYKLLYLWAGEPHFADLSVDIPNPQLWWPNGYPSPGLPAGAAQPLYAVEITLSRGRPCSTGAATRSACARWRCARSRTPGAKSSPSSSTACACSPRAPTGSRPIPSRRA
jgi:hypothetical protein